MQRTNFGETACSIARTLDVIDEPGVLERQPYDQRPRYEYVLARKGTELVDLLPGPGARA